MSGRRLQDVTRAGSHAETRRAPHADHCSTKALSLQPLQGSFRKPIAWAGHSWPACSAGPGARRPASGSLLAISDLLGDEAIGRASCRGSRRITGRGPCSFQVAQLSHPLTQTKPLPIHSRQPALSPMGKHGTRGLCGPGHHQSPRPRPGRVLTQGMFAESINDHLNCHSEIVRTQTGLPWSHGLGAKIGWASVVARHTQKEVEKEFSGFCGTSPTTKPFLSHDSMQNTGRGPRGHQREYN